jgi:predicted nucleotidyltransferase component of viral defense system
VLKDGTCVKKCILEDRFSEDVDFSLLPEAIYSREGGDGRAADEQAQLERAARFVDAVGDTA